MTETLPVTPFSLKKCETKVNLGVLFNELLLSKATLQDMTLNGDVSLKRIDGTKGTIKTKSEEIDELKDFLNTRTVVDLSLLKENVGSFTINQDFHIKSIKLFNNPESDNETDSFTKFDSSLTMYLGLILDIKNSISNALVSDVINSNSSSQ